MVLSQLALICSSALEFLFQAAEDITECGVFDDILAIHNAFFRGTLLQSVPVLKQLLQILSGEHALRKSSS